MGKIANLLFPADYFDKKQPDGEMRTVSLVRPFLDSELPLIYRGWMMKLGEYESFHRSLVRLGLRPITSPEAYAEFHMFPLAYERYEALRSSSPGLLAFPGAEAGAGAVNERFERFMVKDYVKSVKGTSFPASVRMPVSQGDLDVLVAEFVRLRGGLLTEDIVLKEVVDLRRHGGATNEWRAFYLQGKLFNVCRNSNQHANTPAPSTGLVSSCESLGSPYYTVDFAELAYCGWVYVETGDGQVSGLAAAQDSVIYYQVLADRMGEVA